MMMLESREKVIIDSEENLHLLPNVPKLKGFLCLPVYKISSGYGKFHYSVVCRLPYYNDREMGMPATEMHVFTCIYMYLHVRTSANQLHFFLTGGLPACLQDRFCFNLSSAFIF